MPENMIGKHIDTLHQLRNGEIEISTFYFKQAIDKDGFTVDENHLERFRLLLAMQYNRSDNDEPLLRELLEQEILFHRAASLTLYKQSLEVCMSLISKFERVEYVWLFLEAKLANIRTDENFELPYLVSAGIKATYDYVFTSTHELKNEFYECMGDSAENCFISEQELIEWKEQQSGYYPAVLTFNTIDDEIYLALDLGERDILNEKVDEWKALQTEWDEKTYLSASYFATLTGNKKDEIWAFEGAYTFKSTPWDKVSHLLELSRLYLENNEAKNAWNKIIIAQNYLPLVEDWHGCGLGWFIVERAFEIVLLINNSEDETGIEAYKWGTYEALNLNYRSAFLLKKMVQATTLMNDANGNSEYNAMLNKEIKLEEDEMKRLRRR